MPTECLLRLKEHSYKAVCFATYNKGLRWKPFFSLEFFAKERVSHYHSYLPRLRNASRKIATC